MNNKALLLVSLGLIVLAFFVAVSATTSSQREQIDLPALLAPDPELSNHVETEIWPTEEIVCRQTAYFEDMSAPRVVKTTFAGSKGRYLTPVGHYVLYEYLRPVGTLEKEKLVHPEASLSSSVITEFRWRYYAADGKTEVRTENFRQRDNLGATFDAVKNVYTQYRMDGKTIRSIQGPDADKNYSVTYFRPDGTTPWWSNSYGPGRLQVHFDLCGNPVQQTIKRQVVVGSFAFGPTHKPFVHYIDSCYRPDGSLEYRQTWWHIWDKVEDTSFDALGNVEVFAEDGKTTVRNIELNPSPHRRALSIKSDSQSTQPMRPIWLHGFGVDLFGGDNDFVDTYK